MPLDAAAIMTPAVVTVGPDDTVARVAEVLTTQNISAVPVCEKDRTVVGRISEGDLMRLFRQGNAPRRDRRLNLSAEGTERGRAFVDHVRSDRPTRDLIPAARGIDLSMLGRSAGRSLISRAADLLSLGQPGARYRSAEKAVGIMRRGMVPAPETASLPVPADLLSPHHIKRLPIQRDGKLAAIVRAVAQGQATGACPS